MVVVVRIGPLRVGQLVDARAEPSQGGFIRHPATTAPGVPGAVLLYGKLAGQNVEAMHAAPILANALVRRGSSISTGKAVQFPISVGVP
jgi:hypothetical protein